MVGVNKILQLLYYVSCSRAPHRLNSGFKMKNYLVAFIVLTSLVVLVFADEEINIPTEGMSDHYLLQ
jgi:hypothetical protein